MSDYISKSALIDSIQQNVLITLAEEMDLKCEIIDLIKTQPTLSETEIIRKVFERVVERLEEKKGIAFLTLANTGNKMKDIVYNEVMAYLNTTIEIVKEECGISE